MLLDVTCCAGSIPSELGKLSALQSLWLAGNQLSGESNVCLGVSGTFVVSDGGDVSNGIHDVFSSYGVGPLFRERRKILDTFEVLFLDLSGNRVEENDVST